jgi:hypothetical protein
MPVTNDYERGFNEGALRMQAAILVLLNLLTQGDKDDVVSRTACSLIDAVQTLGLPAVPKKGD